MSRPTDDPPGSQELPGAETEPDTELRSKSSASPLGRTVWVIVDGPAKGNTFEIAGDPISIGSAPGNAIRLADPRVSRHHASAHFSGGGLLLKDLSSRNGTFLDGNRVNEAFLRPDCHVRVGSTTLVVHIPEGQKKEGASRDHFGGLEGTSRPMQELYALLERVAANDVTIVIQGETGTGKELAARAVHQASPRAASPFVVLDCAALDRELVSAELFGHEIGAFTGATTSRAGAFELAHRGTVFLDELGELPLELQSKLLRVLEQQEVKRLGTNKVIPVNCRVIAATHRNLKDMVENGKFREDLYYRLAQVVVTLPSLRDRREDIPRLAESFLATLNPAGSGARTLGASALEKLGRAALNGNVRELKNVIRRALALASGPQITAQDLGDLAPAPSGSVPAGTETKTDGLEATSRTQERTLEAAELEAMLAALRRHHWHRARAAAELGITRQTLRQRMLKFGIRVPERGLKEE